jgi:hypothetical protein
VYRCFSTSLRGKVKRAKVLSLFLFAGNFGLPTPIGSLSWGFARRGPAGDGWRFPRLPEEPEVSAAQQEAPEEPEVRAAQQEAPEELNVRAAQ